MYLRSFAYAFQDIQIGYLTKVETRLRYVYIHGVDIWKSFALTVTFESFLIDVLMACINKGEFLFFYYVAHNWWIGKQN